MALGRRYADGEFDRTSLAPLREHLVEAGRSCVHPDHRSGAVIKAPGTARVARAPAPAVDRAGGAGPGRGAAAAARVPAARGLGPRGQAHDLDFDCADFYVLLSLDRVDPRYLRHFLGLRP